MKRYYIRYQDDKKVCGSNDHYYCSATSEKTARAIAYKVKKEIVMSRDIRVYDTETDDESGCAAVIFQIA